MDKSNQPDKNSFLHVLGQYILGKPQILRLAMATVLAQGHLLIEDVPGVGKTRLAKALALVTGCSFGRIQCTPDLTPSDVVGISVYNKELQSFEFLPGPIMNQVVLADELNRTSPRTQSSLLEAMGEGQVSVDGKTYKLPTPFLLIATQNPLEFQGTYPLPEAQRDRFMASLSIGYPDSVEELNILELNRNLEILNQPETQQSNNQTKLLKYQEEILNIHTAPSIKQYILELVGQTRTRDDLRLGLSPRASQDMFWFSKALAWIDGLNYVKPDHIQEAIFPVWTHRLVASSQAKMRGIMPHQILEEILKQVPVPMDR